MINMKKVIEKLIPIRGLKQFNVSRNYFELKTPCPCGHQWFIGQHIGSDEKAQFFAFLQKERFFGWGYKTIALFPYVFTPPTTGTYGDFYELVHKQINDYIDGDQ